MKLNQTLLAAFLAIGFASSAQADIADALTGDGSLFASVSNGATSSAVFDLGYVVSSFLPSSSLTSTAGTTLTWDLTASLTPTGTVGVTDYGTIWTDFSATVTDWSTVTFDVAAMDSTGNSTGSDRYLSTSIDPLDVSSINNTGLSGWGGAIDLYVDSANANDTGADNAASLSTPTTPSQLFADGKGDFWQTETPWQTTQVVGSSADFFYVSSSSNSNFATVNGEEYLGTWLLTQDGILTYTVAAAPVPEADTWAMFAAGLLAVGAIARRRMQA